MYTLAELRNLGVDELKKTLTKAKQELFKLGLTVRTGSEKNTSLIRKARLYIARIQTVLKELSSKV